MQTIRIEVPEVECVSCEQTQHAVIANMDTRSMQAYMEGPAGWLRLNVMGDDVYKTAETCAPPKVFAICPSCYKARRGLDRVQCDVKVER